MRERAARGEARAGFTLVELVVVVLIIGVLAAFAIPSYLKSVENTKADDAASLMNMVGTANRMYALDHTNSGGPPTFTHGLLRDACSSASCAGSNDVCQLVACKYVASQDYDSKPYQIYSADGADAGGSVCPALGAPAGKYVACAKRKDCASSNTPGCTSNANYTAWGYAIDPNGVITSFPASNGPPTATQ